MIELVPVVVFICCGYNIVVTRPQTLVTAPCLKSNSNSLSVSALLLCSLLWLLPGPSWAGLRDEVRARAGQTVSLSCAVNKPRCGDFHSIKWYKENRRVYVYSPVVDFSKEIVTISSRLSRRKLNKNLIKELDLNYPPDFWSRDDIGLHSRRRVNYWSEATYLWTIKRLS